MTLKQLDLPFDGPFAAGENPALWTPREIWVRIDQASMAHFHEQRRVEYKRAGRIDFDTFATYLSTYSNTVDGGVIVFGADSKGNATGCDALLDKQINNLEQTHIRKCPMAKPEFRRFPIMTDEGESFCIAVFIPYVGKLVETNKGEAWIRYGDSRRKMSEEEKRDFRSTHQERAFELEIAQFKYPDDFDSNIIAEFCDEYRQREGRQYWTDEEVLIDSLLGEIVDGDFKPHNNLVLLAAMRPKISIPGARLRVLRFLTDSEGSGANYNPVKDVVVEGNIPKIISEGSRVIEATLNDVTWLNKEGKFVTSKEYPKFAWLEALVNACVHRSYNYSGTEITVKFFPDRMEVESPGSFVPPVSEETIYVTRAARNHHLMDALRHLGYVRMAREGTRRIRDSMSEYDLPEPKFAQESLHGVVVRVTLMNDHNNRKRATNRDVAQFFGVETWRSLQDYEVKIAAFAYQNAQVHVTDAQRITGRTWHTSKKDLLRLVRKGILEYVEGEYERDSKAHFRLNSDNNPDE